MYSHVKQGCQVYAWLTIAMYRCTWHTTTAVPQYDGWQPYALSLSSRDPFQLLLTRQPHPPWGIQHSSDIQMIHHELYHFWDNFSMFAMCAGGACTEES
jgi:hypothetical protein